MPVVLQVLVGIRVVARDLSPQEYVKCLEVFSTSGLRQPVHGVC